MNVNESSAERSCKSGQLLSYEAGALGSERSGEPLNLRPIQLPELLQIVRRQSQPGTGLLSILEEGAPELTIRVEPSKHGLLFF